MDDMDKFSIHLLLSLAWGFKEHFFLTYKMYITGVTRNISMLSLIHILVSCIPDEILDGEGKTTQHVHKGASEVAKQGVGLVISVTEAYDESTFATSEVTQEAVVGTAEVSQRSLDAVAEVESCLVDAAATDEPDGNGQGSASSGDTIVKEGSPRSEGHGNTIEKTPEDGTNKKIALGAKEEEHIVAKRGDSGDESMDEDYIESGFAMFFSV
ncbi:hypothetical protein ACJX0J_032617, partial [Zea mays]